MAEGRVRRARVTDIPALIALEECFPSDRLTRANLRYLLTQGNARLWVWEQDGTIAGSAVLLFRAGSRRARLYSLVTHPARRGRGIGGRLLAAAEQCARQHGCQCLTLEVRPGNTGARRLYQRRGYTDTARVTGFYQDGSDARRMEKPLRPARLQPLARAA